MKHSHSRHTSDELEIGKMILIAEARIRIDLESVIVPDQRQEGKKYIFIQVFKITSIKQTGWHNYIFILTSHWLEKRQIIGFI